jgi:putative Holliday junction resolvase
MGRLLAIDYGRKRCGIAVSDPLQLIANGLDTVQSYNLIPYLKEYFAREAVDQVILGYPRQLNNTPSESVHYLKEFIKQFEKAFPGREYVFMDERFTSKLAMQSMIEGGLKKKQRQNKALIDKVSATILLQSYMEMKNNNSNYR